LLSEKLSHQPQRRSGISAALYQHVEDLAFVVNGTPQIHPLPGDADHHFVQVPSVARARTAPP
jgi:predicted glycosyltransferase